MKSAVLISKENSFVLKGIGILLMLFHHLFYTPENFTLYNDILIHNHGIIRQLGLFAKFCVSLFVFISGYGLTITSPKTLNVGAFYFHRFKKLYFNYWLIWLLFVPVSVLLFHYTFLDAYGSNHLFVKLGLDLLGLINLFGFLGYNPTWWFYSCIIVLYLLFPLLNKYIDKVPFLIITLAVTPLLGLCPGLRVIAPYLLPFLIGMMLAKQPAGVFDDIPIWEIVLSFCILVAVHNFTGDLEIVINSLLCVLLAVFLYRVKFAAWFQKTMVWLGKQSMNIFLFHTFIYGFWFRDFIYASRNPIIIFMLLLLICCALSAVINFIKEKVGFNKLY